MRRLVLNREDHEEAAYELAEAALLANQTATAPAAVSLRNQQRVLSVVRHLERYYHEPWPLKAMANLARLSPCYFLRVFRTVTGQSPTILRQRELIYFVNDGKLVGAGAAIDRIPPKKK